MATAALHAVYGYLTTRIYRPTMLEGSIGAQFQNFAALALNWTAKQLYTLLSPAVLAPAPAAVGGPSLLHRPPSPTPPAQQPVRQPTQPTAAQPRVRVESDPVLTRAEARVYRVLVVLWLTANIGFWYWWLQPERMGAAWLYWILTFALAYDGFFLPSMCLVYAGRMRRPRKLRAAEGLKVALITLCVPSTESFDIIVHQLEALQRVEYPHDSWILDEGNNPAIRAAAEQLGVNYFSRRGIDRYNQDGPPFKAKTKAGNVNAWLDAHGDRYEFFVQFDIDHLPEPDYLERTLGFFRDPRVAWVQAPSVYSNLDNWYARGLSEQDGIFNGVLQHGFFGSCETPFIVGSHCTYRTRAVMQIGGFQPTRAEDHLDTVMLAAHGYRGVYLPEVLARGLGPDTFETYLRQQFAWATSMTQILFHHMPRVLRSLRPWQVAQFLFAQTWYGLHSTTMLILFVLPSVSLLLGQQPAHAVFRDYVLAATPLGLGAFVIGWWTRRWHQPVGIGLSWRGVILHVARWPIAFWALLNVILNIKHPYMVTPKGESGGLPGFPMRTQLIYLGAAWMTLAFVWQYLARAPIDDVQGQIMFALAGAVFMLCVVVVNLVMHLNGLRSAGVEALRAVGHRAGPILTILATLVSIGSTVVVAAGPIVQAATWSGAADASENAGQVAPAVRELLLAATTPVPYSVPAPAAEPVTFDEPAAAAPVSVPMITANAQVQTEPTAIPTAVVARPVAAALPLVQDKLNLGAYDPAQHMSASALDIEHWYIRQDEPELFAGALAHARNRRTPLITIEPFPSRGQRTPVLDRIVAGQADGELRQLAAVARDSAPQIVLIRWGHEMELSGLYPWSANDPEMYRAAYRHVVSVFSEQNVKNVRWVWSPAGEPNALAFYPGDDVVDYVGLTVLGDANWDASFGLSRQSMEELIAPRYAVVQSLGKPILLAELGVSGSADEQQEWLNTGVRSLARFPLVRGVVYFNDSNAPNNRRLPEPDWTLADSNALFNAFAAAPG